jgi:hypothetical protein
MLKVLVIISLSVLAGCANNGLRTSPEYQLIGGRLANAEFKDKSFQIHALDDERQNNPSFFVLKQRLADSFSQNLGLVAQQDETVDPDYVAIFDFESDWHSDGIEKSYYLSMMHVSDGKISRNPEALFFRLTSINMNQDVVKEGEHVISWFFDALEKDTIVSITR